MTDPLSLTRGQIKSEVAVRLGEGLGTDGGGNPVTLDTDVTQVTARICRLTDSFYWGGTTGPGAYGTEINANQIDYCAAPIYKIVSITARDKAGMAWPLTIRTEREFDRMTGDWWRATASGQASVYQSNPLYAYLKGEGSFGIWPVPNYTTLLYNYSDLVIGADGTLTSALRPFTSADIGKTLTVTGGSGFSQSRYVLLYVDANGHATVGGSAGVTTSTGGVAALSSGGITISGYGVPPPWPAETDTCPIQPKNHMTVVDGVCVRRCQTAMASRDKETRAIAANLYSVYKAEYMDGLGDIEAEAATLAQHSESGASWLG